MAKAAKKKPSVSTTKARRKRGLVKNQAMSDVALAKGGRLGKYNARGEHIDGIWFASQAEACRYRQLKDLLEAGKIHSLKMQRKFPLGFNGVSFGTYRADFDYVVCSPTGRAIDEYPVTEDVKGMVTDVYDLKKKLVLACHRISLVEIPAKDVSRWINKIPPPP